MIDNFEIIKSLLSFSDSNDFFMLYIFKRKKDQPEGEKVNSQSVRTIKTYCIHSAEHLEERYEEIKDLCEYFKARTYIHINKQNHKNISLLMMERLAGRIRNNVVNQKGLFDSVVGELHSTEKRWIVDIDVKSRRLIDTLTIYINSLEPINVENKIIAEVPTRNGVHLITSPFRVDTFKHIYPDIDIQKHNPTVLFIPNSIY